MALLATHNNNEHFTRFNRFMGSGEMCRRWAKKNEKFVASTGDADGNSVRPVR